MHPRLEIALCFHHRGWTGQGVCVARACAWRACEGDSVVQTWRWHDWHQGIRGVPWTVVSMQGRWQNHACSRNPIPSKNQPFFQSTGNRFLGRDTRMSQSTDKSNSFPRPPDDRSTGPRWVCKAWEPVYRTMARGGGQFQPRNEEWICVYMHSWTIRWICVYIFI